MRFAEIVGNADSKRCDLQKLAVMLTHNVVVFRSDLAGPAHHEVEVLFGGSRVFRPGSWSRVLPHDVFNSNERYSHEVRAAGFLDIFPSLLINRETTGKK